MGYSVVWSHEGTGQYRGPCFSCCLFSLLALFPFALWMIYTVALCWDDTIIIAHPWHAKLLVCGSVSWMPRVLGAAAVVCPCLVCCCGRRCLFHPIRPSLSVDGCPILRLTRLLSMQLRVCSYNLSSWWLIRWSGFFPISILGDG